MKKISLIIAVAAFTFISCNNDTVSDYQIDNQEGSAIFRTPPYEEVRGDRTYIYISDECEPDKSGNCLPEIVVTPNIGIVVKDFADIILREDITAANLFIADNYKELSRYFRTVDLDWYLKGNLSLSAKVNKKGKTFVFFKLAEDENKILAVYPFDIREK